MSDEQDIRDLLERWAEAVRNGDMAAVLADHTDDIVMFDVVEPIENRGISAYRETWELFFRFSDGGPDAFNLISVEVTASDSAAWCNCILGIQDMRLRLTVGLRKEGGRWLVAHEHHSYASERPDE